MATIPIPQGAQLVPLGQTQGTVPIPQGATLQPLNTQPQQPPEKPGLVAGYAQGFGIPQSGKEWGDAAVNYLKELPLNLATGGIPILSSNLAFLKNATQAGQEIKEAKQNIQQGGPVGENLGKGTYASTKAVLNSMPIVGPATQLAGDYYGSGNPRAGTGALGAAITQAVLPEATKRIGGVVSDALPSKAKAGALFNEASAAAGDQPIDVTAPGNRALQIRELSEAGGAQPKVIRDFIRRTTDPNQGPLTYDEARNFYSNATRISADEAQRLTPVMRYQLQQFTRELGQSIGDMAQQQGVGPQYQGAMKQYRQAMTIQDLTDLLKKNAGKAAVGAAGAYGIKQFIDTLRGLSGK